MNNIPVGATHRHVSRNRTDYYKWAFVGYRLSAPSALNHQYYGWFWWNGISWEYDGGVDETRFERLEK